MATLHQKIVEEFLAKLANSKDVDSAKIKELRSLTTNCALKPLVPHIMY